MRAHRRCRRHHGGEAWGGLDVDITRTVSLTRVSRVTQSTAEKRGSSVTRSHHASREFCHAMRLTKSRYFLTRLWAVHSSHTRVLKWFFLGSNTQSRCVEAHQDARRYGGPTRPSSCRMLGSSPDTRTPAGGDASRAFPARRRRRRTERTPKFAILPSGAVCVALAGALACSGVARVHAALPNGSYEIHAAIDAAYPEGASTSMKSNPPSPRSRPQPRQNA